jgi:hypothetical protein
VRGTLILLAVGLIAIFATAVWLDPYESDGQPRRMETHRQLGLPPCTFYLLTGLPCPSCGMTTSFSFLAHGDVPNSMRANAVGTLLAAFLVIMLPWSLASAIRGRPLGIHSLERALTIVVGAFMLLLLFRWVLVLGWTWIAR